MSAVSCSFTATSYQRAFPCLPSASRKESTDGHCLLPKKEYLFLSPRGHVIRAGRSISVGRADLLFAIYGRADHQTYQPHLPRTATVIFALFVEQLPLAALVSLMSTSLRAHLALCCSPPVTFIK